MIQTLKDKIFLKKFFAISFPVMIQMLVSFFVSFIDNVMVGGISDDVVGAVFSVNQISFFFFVITYGLLSGASIYVQQFSGAKDAKHLQQSVRYKMWIGILFLLIFIPLILFSILINYYLAIYIDLITTDFKKKIILFFTLFLNLAILAVFKYYFFF
jgi:Na+-driven multidrug efflux pump